MDSDNITDAQRKSDHDLLVSESANLLSEVERLEVSRTMLDDRVQNVTHLVCHPLWPVYEGLTGLRSFRHTRV